MQTLTRAKTFLTTAPSEALSDAAGLVGICVLIFAGFTLPAFF